MGSSRGGRLTDHLTGLEKDVVAWLGYENPLPKTGNDDMFDQWEPESLPEQPEVLAQLRQARYLNIPVYPGSLSDTPYLFSLEVIAVMNGEEEFKLIQATNLAIQAKQKNGE